MVISKPKSPYLFLKRSLALAGILIIIGFALQTWFVHNAGTVLKQYISEQSKGKIKLKLSNLDLNLLTKRLQVHEADLLSTDSLNEPITYHVSFSKLSVKVGSVWELLFHKRLLVDSLKLYNPVIQVMQWRKNTAQVTVKDELSIPQEMGKVYDALMNALDEFGVRRIIIDNAAFSLINKMVPGSETVTVSNIFFDLTRTSIKKGRKYYFQNKDQKLELRTAQQNIALPGGRHRLSFKSFNLRLFRQTIELDSCTVTALARDSVKSSYTIFFKKLLLSGVDFSALSTKNLIQADTVYCENPDFDLNLYRSDAVKKKTETPNPNKIIRELAGNLNLAFVGVKNAGIHFDIHSKIKQSFFNSHKDNFEMEGLRINPEASEAVTLKRFNMVLRDYNLHNEDSSSTFSFDSLHFLNSRIVLNNFAMISNSGRSKLRNKTHISVPYFELSDLDWYQLIFEQKMVAREALLRNPEINFTRQKGGTKARGKKIDLFAALLNLDSLVGLENVTVLNGQVNMQLGPTTSFNVQNVDFKIFSNKLLRSTTKEGLRSSLDHLSFSKGVLRLKDITAQLQNARYTDNNLIYADNVSISGQENKIAAFVNKVYINNMQLGDDDAETIEVDGLGWESATVALKALPKKGNRSHENSSTIHLRNMEGNNTKFNFLNGATNISTFIQTLNASSLLKEGNNLMKVEGFNMAGNNLFVNSKAVKVQADLYNISGSAPSSLTGVQVQQIKGRDSLSIKSSQVSFETDLNAIIANDLHLSNVSATAPVIKVIKWDAATAAHDSPTAVSSIRIDKLTATEPNINIASHRNDSVSTMNIPRSNNSFVKATDINITGRGMQIGSLLVNTTAATYIKPTGEKSGVENGKIDMDISNIQVGKKEGKTNWSGLINNLSVQNANGLQIGKTKNNVRFQQASVGNLNLSSEFLPDFSQLMKKNLSAWLRIPQGQFADSNTTLQWYNANYNNSSRTLSLDSFIYHPTQPLDSVLAYAPFQLDYITLKTGAVAISGLDAARYEKDSSFIANVITINKPVLTVYSDKKPPSSPFKKAKPLPVNIIKNILLPVSVQNIQLEKGTIIYTEKNGKSRKEGTLLLSHVNAILQNIKNRDLLADDSLSLTFKASLMDTADLSISLKQSYTDSLGGFLMNTKMASADMTVLNPFLIPASDVKIKSGSVDSVSFRAVGRQDIALGEMNLYYRKLRIKFVKDGNQDKSTFLQSGLNFLANTFVIKSNNSKRKGVIYYKHIKEQSFVNYLIKNTLSGIATSVGAKKNKKYLKKYNQEIKDKKYPAIKL